jgi:hypothetical protein
MPVRLRRSFWLKEKPETKGLIKPYHLAHTVPTILKNVTNIAYLEGYRSNCSDEEFKAAALYLINASK